MLNFTQCHLNDLFVILNFFNVSVMCCHASVQGSGHDPGMRVAKSSISIITVIHKTDTPARLSSKLMRTKMLVQCARRRKLSRFLVRTLKSEIENIAAKHYFTYSKVKYVM